jgi:hypothetical protein
MNRTLLAVLVGGLVAGTLDMTYACAWHGAHGRSPLWVFQAVGSGWLGKGSWTGGWTAGMIGLASHYAISIAAAAVFVAASRRISWLTAQWVLAGAVYGVFVYLFMNYVVIPFSAAPFKAPTAPLAIAREMGAHILLFGPPIAYFTRKLAPPRSSLRGSAG